MPRIPYQPHDIKEPADLVSAIRMRRGGTLLNLDRMLLHSPPFAKGWNEFLREVRTALEISPLLREMAMCVVAVLNGANYEFHHHAPEFLKAGGTEEQVEALRTIGTDIPASLVFNTAEKATIDLAIEMTRNVKVSDATFRSIQSALQNDRLVVELIGVIATYNMVSRILVALDIQPEQ